MKYKRLRKTINYYKLTPTISNLKKFAQIVQTTNHLYVYIIDRDFAIALFKPLTALTNDATNL